MVPDMAQKVWAEIFYHLTENSVMFEAILVKHSMVIIIVLNNSHGKQLMTGGPSNVEATLNPNAMTKSTNPWHVSLTYARALKNTCLKTWRGWPQIVKVAQDAALIHAKAYSREQVRKYTDKGAREEVEGIFVKDYSY